MLWTLSAYDFQDSPHCGNQLQEQMSRSYVDPQATDNHISLLNPGITSVSPSF